MTSSVDHIDRIERIILDCVPGSMIYPEEPAWYAEWGFRVNRLLSDEQIAAIILDGASVLNGTAVIGWHISQWDQDDDVYEVGVYDYVYHQNNPTDNEMQGLPPPPLPDFHVHLVQVQTTYSTPTPSTFMATASDTQWQGFLDPFVMLTYSDIKARKDPITKRWYLDQSSLIVDDDDDDEIEPSPPTPASTRWNIRWSG